MKTHLTKIAAAALGLAITFTISCGEHSWGDIFELGSSSSKEEDYPSSSSNPQQNYDGANPFLQQTVKVDYNISNSFDHTGRVYLLYSSQRATVSTFVNEDGTITVCVSDEGAKTTYIYEFSATLELQIKLSFPYEFDMFGAFTKDSEGNYYFFYGKISADVPTIEEAYDLPENMAMVKYNKSGGKIKTYKRKPKAGIDKGVQLPFRAGICRLEVSGSMLAVYFARIMFKGEDGLAHQASFGFVLNKDTFEEIPAQEPYASHSFEQFILPIDKGFLFADKGDAYPARAFNFSGIYGNNIYGDNSRFATLTAFGFVSAFRFAGE